MSAEVIIGIVSVSVVVLGALIGVLIRLFVAIEHLTGATSRLTELMDDHADRLSTVEVTVANHDERIVVLEHTHRMKGCESGGIK